MSCTSSLLPPPPPQLLLKYGLLDSLCSLAGEGERGRRLQFFNAGLPARWAISGHEVAMFGVLWEKKCKRKSIFGQPLQSFFCVAWIADFSFNQRPGNTASMQPTSSFLPFSTPSFFFKKKSDFAESHHTESFFPTCSIGKLSEVWRQLLHCSYVHAVFVQQKCTRRDF